MISESYAQRIKDYIKDVIKNNDVMNSQKTLPADFVAMSAAAKLFTKSALMGMDGSVRHYEFEEIPDIEDIENLPFTEAVEYLKKRSVLSKVDYEKLSDKLRFRAFTASRIADGDLLKRINAELIKNVDSGDGLKSFLSMTKDELLSKVGMGANQGWYWETVYRTNVQTAYNVGRAMAFEQDKPLAYELIAIDDNRTTDICRPYATKRVVLASDDPFWKTHWPPFHFNCRTTVRAIYDESELPEHFESVQDVPSAKGFGEYPLNTDSWWQELESQSARAKDYGIQEEIEEARKILIQTGARSEIINSLETDDVLKQKKIETEYYNNIRNSHNSRDELILKISKNCRKSYEHIEKIIEHIFIKKHHFANGRYEKFDTDPDIIRALERLKTGEYTDTDLLLLNHEFTELTFMKNKKYNIYEIAHEMANEKYNWQEAIHNENVQKNIRNKK